MKTLGIIERVFIDFRRNYFPLIVPTLQRGNEDRDALSSRNAGAVLRRSHAKHGNENSWGTEYLLFDNSINAFFFSWLNFF